MSAAPRAVAQVISEALEASSARILPLSGTVTVTWMSDTELIFGSMLIRSSSPEASATMWSIRLSSASMRIRSSISSVMMTFTAREAEIFSKSGAGIVRVTIVPLPLIRRFEAERLSGKKMPVRTPAMAAMAARETRTNRTFFMAMRCLCFFTCSGFQMRGPDRRPVRRMFRLPVLRLPGFRRSVRPCPAGRGG